jgi:hypothetical protein
MKRWMDQGYFLMRGKQKVTTEMSLTVLAYNLKRVLNLLGTQRLIAALSRAAKTGNFSSPKRSTKSTTATAEFVGR